MSTPRAGREDESRIEATQQAVFVRVPETTPVTVSADREGTEQLLNQILKLVDVTEFNIESSSPIAEKSPELVNTLREHLLESNTIANLAASSVLSRPAIFIPQVSYSDQVRLDFKIASDDFVTILARTLEKLEFEIVILFRRYIELRRMQGDSPEVMQIKGELISKLEKFLRLGLVAPQILPKVVYRIAAVRGLDLPPILRPTLVNIYMLRADILHGRPLERGELIERQRAVKK